MLRDLLHAHPSLALFNETHWLPRLHTLFGCEAVPPSALLSVVENTTWDTGKDLITANLRYTTFDSRLDVLAALGERLAVRPLWTIQAFSEALARTMFGSFCHWGDKTPDYGFYMTRIQQLWPECRFVHVTRNGLATARSMARHPGLQLMISAGYDNWCDLSFDRAYARFEPRPLALEEFVGSWARRMRRIRLEAAQLATNQYVEVPFEAILDATTTSMRQVAAFLEIDAPDDWLRACEGMVRGPRNLPDGDVPLLARLGPEDLRLLCETRSSPLLELPFDSDLATCRVALNAAEQSDSFSRRVAVGLSVVGTRPSAQHPNIFNRALKLIVRGLLRTEPELATQWASRATGEHVAAKIFVRAREHVSTSTMGLRRMDSLRIATGSSELRLFSCVRNELLRLPYFLRYYRELGVDRFFFVDNDSKDGTREYLLSQPDVHVFHTNDSYAASRHGVDWLNEVLLEHGKGHWVLVVDADEQFVFPGCEQRTLRALTQELEREGVGAVAAFLLDMYSDASIETTHYMPGQPFLDVCRYFDVRPYQREPGFYAGVPLRGGARERMFWRNKSAPGKSPVLAKVPLIRWREDLRLKASTHVLSGQVVRSEMTGALLHFKLFSDFGATAARETSRKEHWQGAIQYAAYAEGLNSTPGLCAMCEESVSYTGSNQLVQLGLMQEARTRSS